MRSISKNKTSKKNNSRDRGNLNGQNLSRANLSPYRQTENKRDVSLSQNRDTNLKNSKKRSKDQFNYHYSDKNVDPDIFDNYVYQEEERSNQLDINLNGEFANRPSSILGSSKNSKPRKNQLQEMRNQYKQSQKSITNHDSIASNGIVQRAQKYYQELETPEPDERLEPDTSESMTYIRGDISQM